MAALASKVESQKIFEKLKTKPANRVRDKDLLLFSSHADIRRYTDMF
jgi:hypothetical protein